MLTYADVCCRMAYAGGGLAAGGVGDTHVTYADACCPMLPYADVC
jgi:hypothetical protein